MLFKGYKYNVEEESQKAINQINEALGIASKNGEIRNYTDYFKNNGFYYIQEDDRIRGVLGEGKNYELITDEEE